MNDQHWAHLSHPSTAYCKMNASRASREGLPPMEWAVQINEVTCTDCLVAGSKFIDRMLTDALEDAERHRDALAAAHLRRRALAAARGVTS